jgi:hypothetical protein
MPSHDRARAAAWDRFPATDDPTAIANTDQAYNRTRYRACRSRNVAATAHNVNPSTPIGTSGDNTAIRATRRP